MNLTLASLYGTAFRRKTYFPQMHKDIAILESQWAQLYPQRTGWQADGAHVQDRVFKPALSGLRGSNLRLPRQQGRAASLFRGGLCPACFPCFAGEFPRMPDKVQQQPVCGRMPVNVGKHV